jgi:hypothetical protein
MWDHFKRVFGDHDMEGNLSCAIAPPASIAPFMGGGESLGSFPGISHEIQYPVPWLMVTGDSSMVAGQQAQRATVLL